MARKIQFILVALALACPFYLKCGGESSGDSAFPESPPFLERTALKAEKPLEGYFAALSSLSRELRGGGQTWLDAPTFRPTNPQRDAPPEDPDLGLDQSQLMEGGELVAEGVNLLNGNILETRLDLLFPSANRSGLPFQAFYNS
jgi:hypothetical protein